MLSYRHAFHAGNHADVLKHLVLVCALDYLLQKADKPLLYVDTHSGPGTSDLRGAMAAKNAEYAGGVGRLQDADAVPAPLARYLSLLRQFNPGGGTTHYPGSPALARTLMLASAGTASARRLELCEMHPADHAQLKAWARGDRRVHVHREDGFARLKALLPPLERRALVLIDPPYELIDDYRKVGTALREALRRFATGVYLVWYPLLALPEARALPGSLARLGDDWLRVELEVSEPAPRGMYGSGVFVINPPWPLQGQLEDCRRELESRLCAQGARGLTVTSGATANHAAPKP